MANVPRIWTDQELETGQTLELKPDAAHHLVRVLRRNSGDPVCLCNGSGQEFSAEICEIRRSRVSVRILSGETISRESTLHLHLGQALSSPRRFDLVLQKATELGVAELTPLNCSRSNTRAGGSRAEDRSSHWQGVLTSACEQCGRNQLPLLHRPADLETWVDRMTMPVIYLHPRAHSRLQDIQRPDACALLIGPEGGLSAQEIEVLDSRTHCSGISLGPRILRTETAPLAAMAIMQYLWGDLGDRDPGNS